MEKLMFTERDHHQSWVAGLLSPVVGFTAGLRLLPSSPSFPLSPPSVPLQSWESCDEGRSRTLPSNARNSQSVLAVDPSALLRDMAAEIERLRGPDQSNLGEWALNASRKYADDLREGTLAEPISSRSGWAGPD
jgi:hypothetical protein